MMAVAAMVAVAAPAAAAAPDRCPPKCEVILTPGTMVDPAAQTPAVVDGGRTVVFLGPTAPREPNGLWSVPVDGSSPPLLLAPGRPNTAGVVAFVDPDVAGRIVFLTEVSAGDFELHSVAVGDPDTRRRLDPRLAGHTVASSGGPHGEAVAVTADGIVVFRMLPQPEGASSLWGAPIDGSRPAARLSSDIHAWDFVVAPGGDATVFRGTDRNGELALYSVSLERRAQSVRLTAPSAGGNVDLENHLPVVSDDGEWVAFLADLNEPGRLDIMTAPIGVASSQRLIAEGRPLGEGGIALFRTASSDLVFLNDPDVPFVTALYSRPFDAAVPAILLSETAAQAADGAVWYFEIAADRRVVYYGNLKAANRIEMYSAEVGVAGSQVTLSRADVPLEEEAWVGLPFLSPLGDRVAYVGMLIGSTVELYSAPVDQAGAQVQLSDSAGDGTLVDYFVYTPDGSHLVYAGSSPTGGAGLYAVAADGATPRTVLADVMPAGNIRFGPLGVRPTADGAWVLFVGDLITDEVNEVFAVPIDGSIDPLRLSRRTKVVGSEASIVEVLPCGGVLTNTRSGRWLQLSAVTIPGCRT